MLLRANIARGRGLCLFECNRPSVQVCYWSHTTRGDKVQHTYLIMFNNYSFWQISHSLTFLFWRLAIRVHHNNRFILTKFEPMISIEPKGWYLYIPNVSEIWLQISHCFILYSLDALFYNSQLFYLTFFQYLYGLYGKYHKKYPEVSSSITRIPWYCPSQHTVQFL